MQSNYTFPTVNIAPGNLYFAPKDTPPPVDLSKHIHVGPLAYPTPKFAIGDRVKLVNSAEHGDRATITQVLEGNLLLGLRYRIEKDNGNTGIARESWLKAVEDEEPTLDGFQVGDTVRITSTAWNATPGLSSGTVGEITEIERQYALVKTEGAKRLPFPFLSDEIELVKPSFAGFAVGDKVRMISDVYAPEYGLTFPDAVEVGAIGIVVDPTGETGRGYVYVNFEGTESERMPCASYEIEHYGAEQEQADKEQAELERLEARHGFTIDQTVRVVSGANPPYDGIEPGSVGVVKALHEHALRVVVPGAESDQTFLYAAEIELVEEVERFQPGTRVRFANTRYVTEGLRNGVGTVSGKRGTDGTIEVAVDADVKSFAAAGNPWYFREDELEEIGVEEEADDSLIRDRATLIGLPADTIVRHAATGTVGVIRSKATGWTGSVAGDGMPNYSRLVTLAEEEGGLAVVFTPDNQGEGVQL